MNFWTTVRLPATFVHFILSIRVIRSSCIRKRKMQHVQWSKKKVKATTADPRQFYLHCYISLYKMKQVACSISWKPQSWKPVKIPNCHVRMSFRTPVGGLIGRWTHYNVKLHFYRPRSWEIMYLVAFVRPPVCPSVRHTQTSRNIYFSVHIC